MNLPSGKRVRVPVDKGGSVDLRRLSAIMDIDDKNSVHDYDERADKVLPQELRNRRSSSMRPSTSSSASTPSALRRRSSGGPPITET